MAMVVSPFQSEILAAVDSELRQCVDAAFTGKPEEFKRMIYYSLGWDAKTKSAGKRLRPLLLLEVNHALGGEWQLALPAAAAVELVHNFSLVHDDIQDRSPTRRGKKTVWVKWGEAQAINAGDAMLAIANLEVLKLTEKDQKDHLAAQILHQSTFDLTGGQYLDLWFESAGDVLLEQYWQMVKGKTGALFRACFELGALSAGVNITSLQDFGSLGERLGIAYQMQDDVLGIWGVETQLGKSIDNDLLTRKKTYPVLYALGTSTKFAQLWKTIPNFTLEDIQAIRALMEDEGIKDHTLKMTDAIIHGIKEEIQLKFTDQKLRQDLEMTLEGLFDRHQ